MDLDIPEDPCDWVPFVKPVYQTRPENNDGTENQKDNVFDSEQYEESANYISVDVSTSEECLETIDSWQRKEMLLFQNKQKDCKRAHQQYENENKEILYVNNVESTSYANTNYFENSSINADTYSEGSPATLDSGNENSNSAAPLNCTDIGESHNENIINRTSSETYIEKCLRRSLRLRQKKEIESTENLENNSNYRPSKTRKRRNILTIMKLDDSCPQNIKRTRRNTFLKENARCQTRKINFINSEGCIKTKTKRYIQRNINENQDYRRINSNNGLRTHGHKQRRFIGRSTKPELNRDMASERQNVCCWCNVPQTVFAKSPLNQDTSICKGFLQIIQQIKSIATTALMGKGEKRYTKHSNPIVTNQGSRSTQGGKVSKTNKQIDKKKYKPRVTPRRKHKVEIKRHSRLSRSKTPRHSKQVKYNQGKRSRCEKYRKNKKLNQNKYKTDHNSSKVLNGVKKPSRLLKNKAPKMWDNLLAQGNKRIYISPYVLTENDLKNLRHARAIRSGSYRLHVFYRRKYYFRNINSRMLRYPMILEKVR